MEWVVRGGAASAKALTEAYKEHRGVPGLHGFSVQHAPGLSVDELARAGQFPHGQISFATEDDLAAAIRPLGYQMRLVRSPGHGYHHTFAVLYDATGVMLQALPADAAHALHQTFQQRPNPLKP